MTNTIASAVGDSRLGVFDELMNRHFGDIDLSPMMVYLIDVVDRSALPWLAQQLDVEGFKGFDQCKNEAQQRELLKQAINLHRNLGTVSAIRQACSIIGFVPKSINEGVPLVDGGPAVWCAFDIELNAADLSKFNADSLSQLRTFINYYKNARSILKDIFISMEMVEEAVFSTTIEERDVLTLEGHLAQDGDYSLDYSLDYY